MYVARCTWYDIACMRNIIPILKSLGLLESEVKTYLAALELGPSTVLEINKKIGLSRQAIYTAIESLIDQGLMSSVEKGKKTLYTSESPERLRSFAEAKLKKMEATVREIKDISKDLTLIQKGDKPIVRMYEGEDGVKNMIANVIKSKPKHLDEFTNEQAVSNLFSEEDLKPLKIHLDKYNVTTNLLSLTKDSNKLRKLSKRRTITRNDIDFHGDVMIYDDNISLQTTRGKLISIFIESKELADTMRALFKLAWDNKNI